MLDDKPSTELTQRDMPAEDALGQNKALHALQSEIDYHRKVVGNSTYLDNLASYIYDGGKSESLNKLEVAYNNEKRNPNSVSREEITKLAKDDQSTLDHTWMDAMVGAASSASAYFGGAPGKIAAAELIALNNVRANDSALEQVKEAVIGTAAGALAGGVFDHGAQMKNRFLGTAVQAGSYFAVGSMIRDREGEGAPDINRIFDTPTTNQIYEYKPVNLEPKAYDFLKKQA